MLNRLLLLSFTLFMALTLPCDASHPADEENPCARSAYMCDQEFWRVCWGHDVTREDVARTAKGLLGSYYTLTGKCKSYQADETLRAFVLVRKWVASGRPASVAPESLMDGVRWPLHEEFAPMRESVKEEEVEDMRVRLRHRRVRPCGKNVPGIIVEAAVDCMNRHMDAGEEHRNASVQCLEETHALLVTYLFPEEGAPPRVDAYSG